MTTTGGTGDGRVGALVRALGLAPHPEGGWYREIFRSGASVSPADGRGERAALTVIWFLLASGQWSRWHRVASDESWQIVEGDPLELLIFDPPRGTVERILLGAGQRGGRAVHVVPAGLWQAARPRGGHALVTCAVAPGFDFADFAFLRDDADLVSRLEAVAPELARLA